MTKQQKSNLAKTAIKLLGERKIQFDMNWWSRDSDGLKIYSPEEVNICGTSCCFAGYGPIALGNGKYHGNSWDSYIRGTFGVTSGLKDSTNTMNFLFESTWPNDKLAAASRALYLLEHGSAPSDWKTNRNSYTIYSAKTLKKKLGAFIYKRARKRELSGCN